MLVSRKQLGFAWNDRQLHIWGDPGGLDWRNIGADHLNVGIFIGEVSVPELVYVA